MAPRRSSLFVKIDPHVTHMPQAAYVPPVSENTDGAMTPELLAKLNQAGTQPQPSDAPPLVDGVADPGVSPLYSRGDHVHPASATVLPSNAPPLADGVADPGVSALYSRGDHVHPSSGSAAPSDANPISDGYAAQPGVSPLYSRGDHVHQGLRTTGVQVAEYDANVLDVVLTDPTAGSFNVNLPPAGHPDNISKVIILKVFPVASPNTVTLVAAVGDAIQSTTGSGPTLACTAGQFVTVISDGGNTWIQIG